MIEISSALIIGILLLLLLLLLGARGISPARESALRSDALSHDDEAGLELCPPEFASKIFSRDDWKFVSGMKSRQLAKLFHRERKAVALLWVQQTSVAIQRVMREHAQASRGNKDLEFGTEMKLVFQYAELMFICGILFVVIQSAGPLWLRGLALHASTLSQRIAQAQQALRTTPQAAKLTA